MDEPEETITEEWLKEIGFKWHDVERSGRNWLLWIGSAIAQNSPYGRTSSFEDFGLELSKFHKDIENWAVFYRADYAGRYTRFIYCRDVWKREQLTRLLEALIDVPFDPANVMYGSLYRPEQAAHYKRQDQKRLDRRIALENRWRADEADDSKAVKK
jgi:hypothetical protein